MSKAEEYFNEYYKDGQWYSKQNIIKFAEAYHQSRVNDTSDEEIMQKRKEIVNEWNKAGAGFTVCADEVFVKTIKWFKNKLLKK